jgi:hypothetical protein
MLFCGAASDVLDFFRPDLLEKDFPTDAWTVEAESKAPNDVVR